MGKLEKKLYEYYKSDNYPFHMPGHKQQMENIFFTGGAATGFPYDITEIDGFDNLHHAQGALKEAQQRAARLYNAKVGFFLVNGSTCGILAAISASVKKGGTLLMGRNSHKAAYNAVYLRDLKAEYFYPPVADFGICGSISPEQVEESLRAQPDAEAVFLTSPTYDGVVSDIQSIAATVHRHKKILIVDEAHGAHFGFHKYFPESSINCGADVVVTSLHKTLPVYTQSALLLLKDSGKLAERIEKFLSIYETSSPSYLFLAQMDNCIELLTKQKEQLFADFAENLDNFYDQVKKLKWISVFSQPPLFLKAKKAEKNNRNLIFAKDPSKILICPTEIGWNGKQLYEKLQKEYQLQLEMYAGHYATALTSIMDTPDAFGRLENALFQMEAEYKMSFQGKSGISITKDAITEKAEFQKKLYGYKQKVMTLAQADEYRTAEIPLRKMQGEISGGYIFLYPPGIPIITPGECISGQIVDSLIQLLQLGYQIEGLEKKEGEAYGKVILPDGEKFFRERYDL